MLTKMLKNIDIAKGLGMLEVIWGHIMLSGASYMFVYAFDIPMFFFISGMLFKNEKYKSFGQFFYARLKRLLVPYVIFSIVTWCIWVSYNVVFKTGVKHFFAPLMQTIIAQGSGGYMVHNVPLWFVTCLFVVEMAYFFICKVDYKLNIIICVLCAVAGNYMIYSNLAFDFKKLPWNIEAAMSAIIFYSSGNIFVNKTGKYYLDKFVSANKILSRILAFVTAAAVFIIAPYNGHITLGSNSLGNSTIVFYLLAFLGIISVLLLSTLIDNDFGENTVVKYIRWIGENSFYFMATHVPIKGFIIRACEPFSVNSIFL